MKRFLILTVIITFMFVNFFFVYVHTTNNATLKKLILTANAWPIEEPFQPSSEIEGEACYFYPPGGGQIFTGRFAIDCFDNYVVTTTCTPISCDEY